MSKCLVCGDTSVVAPQEKTCINCQAKYPPRLIKACGRDGAFGLGLTNGKLFLFTHARVAGEWVFIESDGNFVGRDLLPGTPIVARRGVYVRFSEVMFVLEGEPRQCQ